MYMTILYRNTKDFITTSVQHVNNTTVKIKCRIISHVDINKDHSFPVFGIKIFIFIIFTEKNP